MRPLKSLSISVKTLAWVLIASLAAFVAITGGTYAYQRSRLLDEAHEAALQSVLQSRDAIAQELAQGDVESLRAFLAGLVQTGAIVSIELVVQWNTLLRSNRRDGVANREIDRSWQLDLPDASGRRIGQLRVYESYTSIRERIRSDASLLVMIELLQITGLSAVILLIVYRLITRHLSAIVDDLQTLQRPGAIGLIGWSRRSGWRDELDELVDALNRFHLGQAKAETELRQRIAETETTLAALTSGVVTLDRHGQLIYLNEAARWRLGLVDRNVPRRHFRSLFTLIDEADGSDRSALIEETIGTRDNRSMRGTLSLCPVGTRAPSFCAELSLMPTIDTGEVALIVVFRDISNEIARERQIEFQAFHDSLTRLGNRSLLLEKLPFEIQRARSAGGRVAVLFIDLDNFKLINDNLGHGTGDLLLRELGERLRASVRAPAWATRHGGDEFIVVMPSPGDDAAIAAYAEALMSEIRRPYRVAGNDLRVSCSIGISLFPEHGDGYNELISRADLGMFAAKKLGRNTVALFDDRLQQQARKRLVIAEALKTALDGDEFSLAFQPMFALASGRLASAEVLLRWDCPSLGRVSPALFIPIAEETGLIVDIGDWVLRGAAATAMRWRKRLGREVVLAVNVSALQFQSPRLLATLSELVRESADYAQLLSLEITESALVGDLGDLSDKLRTIRELGFRIAIDDFGTGYSSLSYLKNLPIDALKIDREFIRDLHVNAQDVAIVSAIIQLGRSLGYEIVAEGIETAEAVRLLRELQCDVAQGHHYAVAAPEEQILRQLEHWLDRAPNALRPPTLI
ncbi:putative bifunctional diguanylate cyclase/phosphodiesterase [Hydrocarboniphaga effusa]|jgi:diguanylate cyclase (GGDEF)-like protein|uniref:putative bifunctional diguanylate cyclase/phosphodiesterase n=1 Tax=Hydrocarboniphaga effusa TaxID=243629 RepID=UPI003BA85C85